ncbi:MAG: acyl carrier protein [Desulfatitalea sp.]|nr:acyl carrier protein [Desulfatitalea sp.]NNJ99654.1 acyl carrier protein [Desulfatitalea sp.]
MADQKQLEEFVLNATSKVLKRDKNTLTMETRWVEDLKIKSLQVFMINMMLENEYKVKITMARVADNKTLMDVVDMVKELLANK